MLILGIHSGGLPTVNRLDIKALQLLPKNLDLIECEKEFMEKGGINPYEKGDYSEDG